MKFFALVGFARDTERVAGTGCAPYTFDSGVRVFLCGVEPRSVSPLCDVHLGDVRRISATWDVKGWSRGAIFLGFSGAKGPDYNGYPPEFHTYRVSLDGSVEEVASLPSDLKPVVGRDEYESVFVDDIPSEADPPPYLVRPQSRRTIALRRDQSGEWVPSFEVDADTGQLQPL